MRKRGCGLRIVAWAWGWMAALSAAEPIDLRHGALLFVDDAPLLQQRGVVRTIHPARTRPAPVLEADRPWEGDRVYTYGSIHYDEASRRFRLWYMSRTQRADGKAAAPELRAGGQDIVLLATSEDGVRWEKPALGLFAYEGSKANNIVADLHSPAVIVDRFERDPARRFKLLGYHRGEFHALFSADGIHWRPFPRNPVFKGGDTMTLTQDPRTGEFLAYCKLPTGAAPGRVVGLTRSRDFQVWTDLKLVFQPDAEDQRWSAGPDQRMDVYNMSVLPHAAGFVGLPRMFRITTQAPKGERLSLGQSGHDGPIDVHLATSTDGETWQRTWPRVHVIPRGAPGTFDGGTVLGTTSNAIEVGDETWVYYTAINTGHGGPIPPKRITIGRAEWRRHGFVSLDAGPAGGGVETRPLLFAAGNLLINADASRGRLRAALLEADGREIPGFAAADFVPLQRDATRAPAQWRGGAIPSNRPVRVRLEMTNTRLFSLERSSDGS